MTTKGRGEEQLNREPAKKKIYMDRPSGVTKTVVGISPLLHADAPTLACPEHKEEFNNKKRNDTTKANIFRVFTYIN